MTICISKIFEDLKTEKYDKKNIAIFISLVFLLGICYYFPFAMPKINPIFYIFSIIFWILYTLFQGGYLTLITHNEIHSKPQVVPSLKECPQILKNGLFYLIGNILLSTIISFALFIPALFAGIFFAMIIPVLMATGGSPYVVLALMIVFWVLMLGLTFLLYYLFALPNMLNFFTTLKISDFFEFKKGIDFRKRRKGYYSQFVLKQILLALISFIIPFFTILLAQFYLIKNNVFQDYKEALIMLTFIIAVSFVILFIILIPNLNAQIVKAGKIQVEEDLEYELVEDDSDCE